MKNQTSEVGEIFVSEQRLRSEEIGFKPEELCGCPGCGRMNGPDRSKCLYCGVELPTGGPQVTKLNPRRPEPWEDGWNVVLLGGGAVSNETVAEAARLLAVNPSFAARCFGCVVEMPVARIDDEREAGMIAERLSELGISCRIVGDSALAVKQPPVRIRGLRFENDRLVLQLFNRESSIELHADRLGLIVAGTLFKTRNELIEQRKRRERKTISESLATADEPVLDLYSTDSDAGWRIQSGFDFSCLGQHKGMFAAENVTRLTETIHSLASAAKLDTNYMSVRSVLDEVWPPETRRDSLGFQRSGFGRKEIKNVTVADNSRQFTMYSRLRRHLL